MEFTSARPQLMTYEKVRRLTRKLQEPGNVNEKRKLALELEQLMSNFDVQAKLAEEATPSHRTEDDFSLAASRCRGLSTLWSAVFTAAIQFTNGIIKGENGKRGVKPTPADIGFPDKLLRAATGPDPVFDAQGLAIPKLNKKTVRSILRFCLEMLDNEKVIENGGEVQMLEMLARICSRPEYLGFVKEARFQTIISEITRRLTEEVSPDVYLVACKAFDAFFETSSQLGHPFHMFLSDSLRIVAAFFQSSLQQGSDNASPATRVHMFNATASMLFAHPDHSIGPMKRYGRHILRSCKKTYANAPAIQREAMNKYLLSHLFVAQVAGKVQGRLDGDLGDLGQATLSEQQLVDLLGLVVPITMKVLEPTMEQKTVARESRQRKRDLAGESSWREMAIRQKLHLELTARLLACGQRLFLARESWDSISDEMLQSLRKAPGSGNDDDFLEPSAPDHPRLSPSILSKSPWMYFVLRGLIASSNISSFSDTVLSLSEKSTLQPAVLGLADQLVDHEDKGSVQESPVPFLAIIAASCECYPAGECWTSNAAENWKNLDAGRSNSKVDFHPSSPEDLALVLLVLLRNLEIHGRPDGDTTVQHWILLCLAKLTEATAVMLQLKESKGPPSRVVTEIWRGVWSVLFRSDLRYVTYSKSVGENSLGELFHLVLTEMIRRKCTEMSGKVGSAGGDKHTMFIFKHQRDVWGLRAFNGKTNDLRIARSHFELAAVLLRISGLSEDSAPSSNLPGSSSNFQTLRGSLLSWSLFHLDKAMRGETDSISKSKAKNLLISAIASCVTGFSSGYAVLSSSLSSKETRFLLTTFGFPFNGSPIDTFEDSIQYDTSAVDRLCLQILWDSKEETSGKSVDLSLNTLQRLEVDTPLLVALALRRQLDSDEKRNIFRSADFVSEAESDGLCKYVLAFINDNLFSCLSPDRSLRYNSSEGTLKNDRPIFKLSSQSVAAKLVISNLIMRKENMMVDFLGTIPDILSFFQKAVSDLGELDQSPGDYLTVAKNLRQIAVCLVEIHSRYPGNLDCLVDCVEKCRAILKKYKEEVNCRSSLEKRPSRKRASTDDLFMDEENVAKNAASGARRGVLIDSDSGDSVGGKRMAEETLQGAGKKFRKMETKALPPLSQECALEISALLLTIDPTPPSYMLVLESLMRTELDLEPDSIGGDIDLRLATTCVGLLTQRNALLCSTANEKLIHDIDYEDRSIVVILCRAVELIRACSDSSSGLFQYGAESCGKVVIDVSEMRLELKKNELGLLSGVLGWDNDMVYFRPALAVERLRCATRAFSRGNDLFRESFDRAFPLIVKAGLRDLTLVARRIAYNAAAVAMQSLDEERVLKSVADNTCPVMEGSDEENIISSFSGWFAKSPFAGQDIPPVDQIEVFESDAIFAKATIAGATSNADTFIQILFEILQIPLSRPGLEFMCFRALKIIAHMRDYSSVQEMVNLEAEAILVTWFKKRLIPKAPDQNSRFFSACLTTPEAVELIQMYGQYKYFAHTLTSCQCNDESMPLRQDADMKFILGHRGFLTPFLLFECSTDVGRFESSEATISFLSSNPNFRLLLFMLPSENGDRVNVVKLLKRHVIDILGFCAPFDHCGDLKSQKQASMVRQCLYDILSEDVVKTKLSKQMPLLIRRILALVGKTNYMKGILPASDDIYFKTLSTYTYSSKATMGDVFTRLGTSLTELTLNASRDLHRSRIQFHQSSTWSQFLILGRFLVEQLSKKSVLDDLQLGFFLHAVTEMLLKPKLETIRPLILGLILNIMKDSIQVDKSILKREVGSSVQRLLGVCFHTHEIYQRKLLIGSRRHVLRFEMSLRKSCGLRLPSDLGVWDKELEFTGPSFSFHLRQELKIRASEKLENECLSGTYDVIQWIIENKDAYGLDAFMFRSLANDENISKSDLKLLQGFEKKYCAQVMTHELEEELPTTDVFHRCVANLKQRTLKPHPWVTKAYVSSAKDQCDSFRSILNIDQRLLFAELVQMEEILGEIDIEKFPIRDVKSLLSNLCCICTADCPEKLRFAASRCMSFLTPRIIVESSDLSEGKTGEGEIEDASMLMKMLGRCMDCLAECLQSTETEISTTAAYVLKEVLPTSAGKEGYVMAHDASKSLLKPFINMERKARTNEMLLSKDEVKKIMKTAGLERLDNPKWCWERHLWNQTDEDDGDFEQWVCVVTTAMILCCCRDPGRSDKKTETKDYSQLRNFFWRCQRSTFLDHQLATAVFPCLVLVLLQVEDNGHSEIAAGTNEIETITDAFKTLLQGKGRARSLQQKSSRMSSRHRAVCLAIDTLDLLKRISEEDFLGAKHKRSNSRNTLDPTPWKGIPYGIIMRLGGLQVAEACLETQRFASALFYIELFLNAQYGKSGGLFEDLSTQMSCRRVLGHFKPCPDISGRLLPDNCQNSETKEVDLRLISSKAMSIVATCYRELHEEDALSAISMQLSSLNLTNDEVVAHLGQGQFLPSNSEEDSIQVAETLLSLGFNNAMKTYIEGVSQRNSALEEICVQGELREKWFESNLHLQSWNKLASVSGFISVKPIDIVPCGNEPHNCHPGLHNGFFEMSSRALESFFLDDLDSSADFLKQAWLSLIDSVTEIGSEQLSADDAISVIDRLRAVKDLEDLVERKECPPPFHFDEGEYLEVSMKLREVTLEARAVKYLDRNESLKALKRHLVLGCTYAIDQLKPNDAEACLWKLRSLARGEKHTTEIDCTIDKLRTRVEEAKIMECRGDFTSAIQRMRHVIGYLSPATLIPDNLDMKGILADANLTCANWMNKYKTQNGRVVLETYLHPAVDQAKMILEANKSSMNAERVTRGSLQVGHVLGDLYDGLLSRVQSNEWKEAGLRLQKQKLQYKVSNKAFNDLPKSKNVRESAEFRDLFALCGRLQAENDRMEKERQEILASLPRYLTQGLEAFIVALKTAGNVSGDLSSHVFRMISIWFSSQDEAIIGSEANAALISGLPEVPSYRFVPLTNQLFSRVDGTQINEDHFQLPLQTLIFRMCNDHPYHCIVPLMALSNGNLCGKGSETKVTAAHGILKKLRKDGMDYVRELVESYDLLISACNDTAFADVTTLVNKRKTKKIKFSELLGTASGNLLDRCLRKCNSKPCVLTSPPHLQPSSDYGNGQEDPIGGERIHEFESYLDLTDTGIHRPKIVICIGSKGGRFRQLVKGEDDLRQDAIMMQVFSFVNKLLERKAKSLTGTVQSSLRSHRSRKMKIATYHILPLSPQSGVLEWVDNTTQISNYLDSKGGAHMLYYPDEWDSRYCRMHLTGETSISKEKSKQKLLEEIYNHYSPSLRFFFLEQFKENVESWHIAKTKYTRSVAVSSMVGHILGIGDRHLGNILINEKTGVVVHIDFGVVFEQGKLLKVPELVPFRLTRNIIDPMGPCGTEGTFQEAAKETIAVLRKNARDLLTILSAVVADPLYQWQNDPEELQRRQNEKEQHHHRMSKNMRRKPEGGRKSLVLDDGATVEKNAAANRRQNDGAIKTVNKIKQKLDGYEDSALGEQQGVEGQVQLLINSARDLNLLAEMYPGWGPWT